jgi:hypothetical protein
VRKEEERLCNSYSVVPRELKEYLEAKGWWDM